VLLAPTWALAADPYGEDRPLNLPADGPAKADIASGSGGSLVRTFVGLAIVVAVIYGLTWVLRQMKAAKDEGTTGFGLSSEATVALGPGRSVHLIRAGRELVLVGSAEQGVVPIRTYTEDEAARLGLLPEPGTEADSPARRAFGPTGGRGGQLLDKLRQRTLR
jgi:flagellar protein FliO/FliZ